MLGNLSRHPFPALDRKRREMNLDFTVLISKFMLLTKTL